MYSLHYIFPYTSRRQLSARVTPVTGASLIFLSFLKLLDFFRIKTQKLSRLQEQGPEAQHQSYTPQDKDNLVPSPLLTMSVSGNKRTNAGVLL